jgi:hypothetical protein
MVKCKSYLLRAKESLPRQVRMAWGIQRGSKMAAGCLPCGLLALRLAYPAGSLGAATPECHKAISGVGAQKQRVVGHDGP